MAHRVDHDLIYEQPDDDRGRAQQNVVDETHDEREFVVAAVLGHVGAGKDAERRADQDAETGEDQAADDRIEQAAASAAGRRGHLGEHLKGEPAESLPHQRAQDQHQPA